MPSSGILRRVALVACSVRRLLVTANVVPSSPILVTMKMEELGPPKRRFLQTLHRVTSQKTAFFIVNALKTLNLT
jgi:hypothetical protein